MGVLGYWTNVVSTQRMTSPDPLNFLAFDPDGISVRGTHLKVHAPLHFALQEAFEDRRRQLERAVLARPGGFNGARAALTAYRYEGGALHLETQFRTYVEGLALRQELRLARERGTIQVSPAELVIPNAALSWGLSVSAYVLLPHDFALCAQRSPAMTVSPGLWTMSHSEIVEPEDIAEEGMQPLLVRLIQEEIPVLRGLGPAKFVGLGVRPLIYGWQLIAVLDLRSANPEALATALANLEPDTETSAWSLVPLESTASFESLGPLPEHLRWPGRSGEPSDFSIARSLNQQVPVC